jgi:putative toxin-antitoxin system antitoxin component (TIGR02293 family)
MKTLTKPPKAKKVGNNGVNGHVAPEPEPLDFAAPSPFIARAARVFATVSTFFRDDVDAAAEWLMEPHHHFDGKKPWELCRTEAGAARVERLIFQLSHGVYV